MAKGAKKITRKEEAWSDGTAAKLAGHLNNRCRKPVAARNNSGCGKNHGNEQKPALRGESWLNAVLTTTVIKYRKGTLHGNADALSRGLSCVCNFEIITRNKLKFGTCPFLKIPQTVHIQMVDHIVEGTLTGIFLGLYYSYFLMHRVKQTLIT